MKCSAEHNKGKSRFTKNYKPWKIIYTEEKETLEEAIKREKYFKSSAGRRKIKLLLRPDSSAG
ncbi:MAG: hypothetical protein K8F60_06155 [Melioribacteraceae bacterium]|nr:hypothetical protein [Melioribacteraceae bacterium]